MRERRNDHDVTNRVNTTDFQDVSKEIGRIYQELYQRNASTNARARVGDALRWYSSW